MAKMSDTSTRSPGRPEVGPAFSLRFPQDLIDKVDAAAMNDCISRAELIRRIVTEKFSPPSPAEVVWNELSHEDFSVFQWGDSALEINVNGIVVSHADSKEAATAYISEQLGHPVILRFGTRDANVVRWNAVALTEEALNSSIEHLTRLIETKRRNSNEFTASRAELVAELERIKAE